MTFQRDLAWKYLDIQYQSSVSHHLARYGLTLAYDLLPPQVIRQAKRSLLDALGCALGAYEAPGRPMCETVVKQLGGTEEATVFGSGLRTSAANASLVNSFLVRFLDFNDIGGGGHNSDAIPALLAVAEKEKLGGKDLITAIVVSYELGARFSEASGFRGAVGDRGWTSDVRGGLTMPPALGKMMGLNEEQIANAIGICACHSLPLGILDTDKEENSMSKNLRFGWVAYDAIISCMLAKQGFTGPVRIVEGENGLGQAVLRNIWDIQRMLDFSGWRILNTGHKVLCLNGGTIGYSLATLALAKEHNLKPEDVVSVRVKANLHESQHTTILPKKYPRNGESADHSAFYATAMAIKEHEMGPQMFEPERFTDPVILDLIEKITVEYDPTLTGPFSGAVEITLKDGGMLQKRMDNVHGFGNDPLSDKELEDKFVKMASRYLGKTQIQSILDTVWNLDTLGDVGHLAELMIIPSKPGSQK